MPFGVLFSKRVCENNRKLQNLFSGYEYNEKRLQRMKEREREMCERQKLIKTVKYGPKRYGTQQRREFLELTGAMANAVLVRTAMDITPSFSPRENPGDQTEEATKLNDCMLSNNFDDAKEQEPPFFDDNATYFYEGRQVVDGSDERSVKTWKELANQSNFDALRLRVELLWEELHVPYRDRDAFMMRCSKRYNRDTCDEQSIWRQQLEILLEHRRKTRTVLRAIKEREAVLSQLRMWCETRSAVICKRGGSKSMLSRSAGRSSSLLAPTEYATEAVKLLGFEVSGQEFHMKNQSENGHQRCNESTLGVDIKGEKSEGVGKEGRKDTEAPLTEKSKDDIPSSRTAKNSRIIAIDEQIENLQQLEAAAVQRKDYRQAAKMHNKVQELEKRREEFLLPRTEKKQMQTARDKDIGAGFELIAELISKTVTCVQSIIRWRETLLRPRAFLWRGYNYMELMARSENGSGGSARSSVDTILKDYPWAADIINYKVLGKTSMSVLLPDSILQEPDNKKPSTTTECFSPKPLSYASAAADFVTSTLNRAIDEILELSAEPFPGSTQEADTPGSFYRRLVEKVLYQETTKDRNSILELSVGRLMVFEPFVQVKLQREHDQLVFQSKRANPLKVDRADVGIFDFECDFIPMLRWGKPQEDG